jgi:triacylglycerol lipase
MNIVLAHGVLGSDKFGPVDYFNGVADFLKQKSIKVLVTKVDPIGRVKDCAGELREQITRALGNGTFDPAQKTHIIAHSKGGLESRFLLSPTNTDNIADRITSLTTISSPHQGSPVADVLFSPVDGKATLPFGLRLSLLFDVPFRLLSSTAEDFTRNALNLLGIPVEALRDLTSEGTRQFNDTVPDHNQVRYFSIAGSGRASRLPTCKALLLTHQFISNTQADNDGLVSVRSAIRTDSRWEHLANWPADHADEVGHDIDRGFFAPPTGFNHLQEYEKLIERLAAL